MRPALLPVLFDERRTGVGPSLVFDPATISGLQFDYRSDAGLFTTAAGSVAVGEFDDDPVGRWEDQSGNTGRNLTQSTGSKRPTFKLNILPSGKAVVRGDGVDDILKSAAFTLDQPTHLFLVVRQIAWTNGEYITDGASNITLALRQATTTPRVEMSAGSAGPATTSLTIDTAFVVSLLFDGASSELRVNGGAAVTGDVGVGNAGGLSLFGRASDALWANVDLGRVIGYNVELSSTDREYVESGLKAWAGIV